MVAITMAATLWRQRRRWWRWPIVNLFPFAASSSAMIKLAMGAVENKRLFKRANDAPPPPPPPTLLSVLARALCPVYVVDLLNDLLRV